MTAAQFEDAEGRDLVEAEEAIWLTEPVRTWSAIGVPPAWITVPTTTRPIHLPIDKECA